MRKYLSTLHTRSDEHKKRFALFTSAGVTLVIFAFWSMATFGTSEATVASANSAKHPVDVSPLKSLVGQVGLSFDAIKNSFTDFKQGLEVVNFQADYTKTNGR